MSKIQEILESMAKYLTEADEYFNKEFYFDLSQLNPNVDCPCLCFQIEATNEPVTQLALNPECRSIVKSVSLLSCIDIVDQEQIIEELWNYEELLISVLRRVMPYDIHPDLIGITYTSSTPFSSLWLHSEDKDESTFFSNSLTVTFDIEYAI